jgi:solute:Na+ symporter, SSS family
MFVTLDWIVIAAYFAVLFGIAVWVIRKKQKSASDYFLAGRHVGWFVIGTSIFASNVGSEHVVGLAGSAADSGLVLGHYELHSWLCLLLGWVFVPFYLRSKVFTMPEFLERRYGSSSRWLLSVTMLISYVLTKISVTIYAGAIVCDALLGVPFWQGASFLVVLTGVYTVLGGMRAVVYTEALQAIVLIVGSVIITIAGLNQIGGWDKLVETVGPEKLNMFRPASDPEFPWTGMVFAPPIIGLWYWCTDQYIVQRVLATDDEQTARRGTILAGYLKLLPFFIFMIPGLVAFALAKSGQMDLPKTDEAFPKLVETLLPAGLRGLVAGGLLAALMSSLAAVFNSSSTLFTMDIYAKLRPSTDAQLVRVGRIATVVLVVLGMMWVPFLEAIAEGQMYKYLQNVQGCIAPPIAAVFFLGLFWRRINATGAVTTLIVGFVLGMARLVTEVNKVEIWFATINFLHFAIFLFLFSVCLLIGVSLFTAAPSDEQLDGLTYGTTMAADRAASRASWGWTDVVHSIVILTIILGILLYFSPLNFGS